MSRKKALVRLKGLAPQVEEHLEKLRNDPTGRDAPHWRKEVEAWLTQIESLLPHLGGKTSDDWMERLKNWQHDLDQTP